MGKEKWEISPPFLHLPVLGKRPILQPITSPPLPLIVEILVPELHSYLIIRERK